ncbi:type VI secretion system-associated FHA domain protein TagH [Jiella sonneratiae]|uniref:Type VI secretion system-associated FHA domain protein TagH n=1 Tax=Jiella sonneratiae TaxID=2816856 RepID=A0ABS3J613_9HYPH|nr:type VI secretion system-associated FHA domain protein TagH [Jiella sonneratiae]MBO0905121.1 type VI secretion system-associated FHA domain protein TagH [Jiella sonneratiae]
MRIDLLIENFDTLASGGPTRFSAVGRSFEIGREPPRDFLLPDPDLFVSSRHCEIRCEAGGFTLVDHSTNGTFLNGSEERISGPRRLETGDRLRIGHYLVAVAISGAGARDLGDHGWDIGSGEPAREVLRNDGSGGARDPLAGRGGEADANPWEIDGPVAPPVDLAPPPRPDPPPFEREPVGFDLGGGRWPEPAGAAAWSDDPGDLGEGKIPDEPGRAEHRSRPFEPGGAAATDDAPPGLLGAGILGAGLRGADVGRDEAVPVREDDPFGIGMPASRSVPGSAKGPGSGPGAGSGFAPAPYPLPGAPDAASDRRLLALIAEAAGLDPAVLTNRPQEEAAREIGALLALVAGGVGDLLRMRAKAKTLTRSADRTTIEAVGNNALKFSPTAEAALAKMLGADGPGYLSAARSFEEAFDDLARHELVTFAAMQKALKRLIDDLSPESILARTPAAVMPFAKKAQAWDLFVTRWDAKTEPFEHGMLDVFLQYFREIYDETSRSRGG